MVPYELARITGCTPDEVSRALQELKGNGVYSSDANGIYSRRMVRDQQEREKNARNGSLGGRPPKLPKAKPKPNVTQPVSQGETHKSKEVRSKNQTCEVLKNLTVEDLKSPVVLLEKWHAAVAAGLWKEGPLFQNAFFALAVLASTKVNAGGFFRRAIEVGDVRGVEPYEEQAAHRIREAYRMTQERNPEVASIAGRIGRAVDAG